MSKMPPETAVYRDIAAIDYSEKYFRFASCLDLLSYLLIPIFYSEFFVLFH